MHGDCDASSERNFDLFRLSYYGRSTTAFRLRIKNWSSFLKGNRERVRKRIKLAIGPVSRDSTEGNESSAKASDLGIVDVVVVIGVVVGPGDEGNLKKASVRTIVGVVVIVNVAEGTEAGED